VRIGLVLGAGGSVGVAYHGAVVAALEEATGWDPRSAAVMVGTSAGAITAAMLRAGVPAADLARISEGKPLSDEGAHFARIGRPRRPRPQPSDLFRVRPMADPAAIVHALTHPWCHSASALVAAVMPAGGIPTHPISTGVNTVFAGGWPADPLWLCAVDLREGKRVVFGRPGAPSAPVGTAVAASAAIPAYFQPVTIEGHRYVDGGVHSMVNVDLAAALGLDLVIVSAPMSDASSRPSFTADRLWRMMLRARLRAELRAFRGSDTEVAVIEPSRRVLMAMGLNPMDARRRGPVSTATTQSIHEWLTMTTEGAHLAFRLSRAASSPARPPAAGPDLRRRPSA
jgi:NTE family protein